MSPSLPAELESLIRDLVQVTGEGVHLPLAPDRFQELALRAFALQYRENPTYGAFCRARNRTPDTVEDWKEVPPVPAMAFKHLELVVGAPEAAERTFRTSGTTRGAGTRGVHRIPSLRLYRASLLPPFREALLPDGARLPLLSLVPSPEEAPDSSLSEMVGTVARELCPRVDWCAGADGAPDVGVFLQSARAHVDRGEPVLVTGTAFAFVHLLDRMVEDGVAVALPEGSRIMETGGFKGRSRSVSREELYRTLHRRLGVPDARIVNEYGMTELLSQLYEPVLREGAAAPRRHVPPPWLRVRALDPATLAPLPDGRPGLLAFFDLANAGSVSAVLTEDVGTVAEDGVRLRGRVPGAEPRGCSLALEDLLRAAEPGAVRTGAER